MKIECDKCAAKYSIADDKVRGKTFKIRCKKCGNVIIVRDKGAAGGADDAADDAGGDVAAAGWHLAVDGETVGPVADDEVRRRFRSGQIDGETAVWQEGFEDWIPLASVPAFADLVAGGGAAAADPFGASGGDDPFAAGNDAGDDGFAAASGGGLAASASFGAASSGGGLSAAPAAAAAPKQAEAATSPRATQLTGQRNENSVLFSLDSLRAMAGAAPSGGGGGGGGAAKVTSGGKPKVATSAPTSEGSGLIDIRAMGAVLGSGSGGGGAAADFGGGSSSKSDDDVLPTFGGGGFGGLSATPLVVTPPPSAAAAAPEPKSNNTVLYAIVAILAIALIGLGVLVVMQMNKEPVKEVVIKEVPGSVADGDKDKDEDKEKEEEERKKKEEEEKKKKEEEEKAAAEAAAADTGGEAPGGVEGSGKTGSSKTGSKSGSGKTTGTSGTATPTGDTTPKTEPKPEPKTNPADDVDCLLDPSLAKCKGGGSKSSSGGSKSSGGSTGAASGPEKLSQADLLDGIKGVKASAQACGSKHGVTGVKIPVKLSIEGSTGRVISASAQGDYAGKPVGNCVAAELKKAEFKKFTSAQMGFTYNVSL